LAGACPEVVAATVAEIIWTIQNRMDYSRLQTPEQRKNFDELVQVAAGLLCEACPEFIVPVEMNVTAVREISANELKKYQTVH
jgi:hypothetical protein